MTEEKFEQKQAEMSNEELIRLANKEVIELCKTGGKSIRMCVPPSINDTDMLLSEVIRRFEKLTTKNN
jgi:phosphoheptose isomerase